MGENTIILYPLVENSITHLTTICKNKLWIFWIWGYIQEFEVPGTMSIQKLRHFPWRPFILLIKSSLFCMYPRVWNSITHLTIICENTLLYVLLKYGARTKSTSVQKSVRSKIAQFCHNLPKSEWLKNVNFLAICILDVDFFHVFCFS